MKNSISSKRDSSNLIKVTSLTRFPLLIFRGIGDLKKPHYKWVTLCHEYLMICWIQLWPFSTNWIAWCKQSRLILNYNSFLVSKHQLPWTGFGFMVFNAIFYNISVLLVEETGVPRKNHRPVASHWQTLSHNVISWRSVLPINKYNSKKMFTDDISTLF